MKRTWVIFNLFFGISVVSASDTPIKNLLNFNFSGWYIGTCIGYSQTNVKSVDTFQCDANVIALRDINGLKTKVSLSGRNVRAGFFGGWGYQHNLMYLGGEAEGIIQNIISKTTSSYQDAQGAMSSHNISATLKDSYALSFKGGYVFNPDSMLYLKAGVIFSRWKIQSFYPSLVDVIDNPKYTTPKRSFGLLLGTGIEKAINNNLIAGAEVSYALYKKISYKHPHMNEGSISPSAFSFGLKLTYKIE